MAFDHHKPSALEALHTCPALSTRIQKNRLRRSRVDQRAPYVPEYDSSLCLLWPRWMAFLGILTRVFYVVSPLKTRHGNRSPEESSAAYCAIEYDS